MREFMHSFRPLAEDLAGTLTFYLLYLATGSARLSAAVGLGLGCCQLALHLLRRRRPPTLLMLGVALTMVLGGLTLVTANPRFLLLKPSIIYLAVGATMLPRGWLMRYVPPIAHDLLPAATIDRAGWGWAALMLATALVNVALVLTLAPRLAAALLGGFALGSKLLLFGAQYWVLRGRARRAYTARYSPAARTSVSSSQ